ncbi:sensor histidine kinase [Clostridium sp. DL1XJH146]
MISKYVKKIILFILLLISISFLYNNATYAANSTQNHILILNSYHQGYIWTDNVINGINSILNNSNNVIRIEYMDTKVIKDSKHMNNLYELYKHKYANSHFDVIIASDNDAYEFLKLYRKYLFPDTPVVVCGLNEYDNYITNSSNSFTGISEIVDIKSTLDLALQLFPNTENIYVISDNSSAGISNEGIIRKTALYYPDEISFNYIKSDYMEVIADNVSNLPPNSIIFTDGIFKDSFGELIDVKEGIKYIYERSNVPLFSCWQMHMGNSVIGGKMISGYEQGQAIANMANEVLYGKDINEIPFKEESINKYVFDYTLLKKYSINIKELPKESIFINMPSTSFQIEKNLVYLSIIALIISLLLIILIMHCKNKELNRIHCELSKEKETLQSILNSTCDAILVTNNNNEIINYNKNFIDILFLDNYKFYPNEKENFAKIIKEITMNPTEVINWFKHCLANSINTTIIFSLKDNNLIEGNCENLITNNIPAGHVWSFRDITRKKEIENLEKEVEIKARLLDEAKKYDYMKDQFLATISHELKTPLNIILGIVQIVDNCYFKNSQKPDVEKLKNYIKISKQNCYRLLKLINNLIDITKINSGFMNLNIKNYNIVNVIEEISLSIACYAESKGITLIFDTEIEEKFLAIDANQIERIMLNLFSNAIKFADTNGTIEVNIYDKGNSILISVKDSGIGIPYNMQEKIFDRFRQVDSSLSRKAEGIGIGLALVKSIVELHNGNISLISELGKGCEFIIELPVFTLPNSDDSQNTENTSYNSNVEKICIEFSDIYS